MKTVATMPNTATRRPTKKERDEEKLQERKNFLRAVLVQEMQARLAAEEQLSQVESDLGLIGTHHGEDYERVNGAGSLSGKNGGGNSTLHTRDINDVPSVNEQYNEIIDELQYVSGQPVGSKESIIRMHYLLEEEERVKSLRQEQKRATFTKSK